MPMRKKGHKCLSVSNVALVWVVLNWPHGCKGVKGHPERRKKRPGGRRDKEGVLVSKLVFYAQSTGTVISGREKEGEKKRK